MLVFLGKRLVQAIPVMFLVTLVVFVIVGLIPGNPAAIILGPGASQEAIAAVTRQMGLDRPLPQRYVLWLSHILRGDLGVSYLNEEPVLQVIGTAIPVTTELAICAVFVALLVSLPGGIIAAAHQGRPPDIMVRVLAIIGTAMPVFISSVVLIFLFGVRLEWLPASGYAPLSQGLVANLRSMILPAVSLGMFVATPLTRYLRAEIIKTMTEDYVNTARMKGLSELRIQLVHVTRNALGPFVTALGIQVGYLLGGAVLIETIFALPGIGLLSVKAISTRDYEVLQGVVLLVGIGFVAINIVVDLIQFMLSPRLRSTLTKT